MDNEKKIVRIFTAPIQFPCGEGSFCCGPIGQNKEDIERLSNAIKELGVSVEIYNIMERNFDKSFPQIASLLGSLGPGIVPILSVGEEIISIGSPSVEEAVQIVKEKI
ncbi:MAG: hypothetical protein ACP5QT_08330 [Brevinematia bacterium]